MIGEEVTTQGPSVRDSPGQGRRGGQETLSTGLVQARVPSGPLTSWGPEKFSSFHEVTQQVGVKSRTENLGL